MKDKKTIKINSVTANAVISTSGYNDRYPMDDGLRIAVEIEKKTVIINAFSFGDAAEQLTAIAQLSGIVGRDFDDEWQSKCDFRKTMMNEYKLFIPFRDVNTSSKIQISRCLISDVIAHYTDNDRLNEQGREKARISALSASREQLLGIKQQMDEINVLIDAGLKKSEKVAFNWSEK